MNTKVDALRPSRRPRRAAFTLIELLTVVAIIGVLAAILIPALGKARQIAKQSACASNLRQIGLALTSYLNDNKGALPGRAKITDNTGTFYGLQRAASATWYYSSSLPTRDLDSQLLQYFNTTNPTANGSGTLAPFLCPANPNGTKVANYYIGTQVINTGGALQRPIGYNGSGASMMFSQIANPSRAAFLFDCDAQILSIIGQGAVSGAPATSVHGSTRNVLYFDGHVAAVAASTNPMEHL